MEEKWWLVVGIAVLIGGVGVYSIYYSSSLNEHLEEKRYDFWFTLWTEDFNSSSNKKMHIHDFRFFYDFTQNKGNISFGPGRNNKWDLKYIHIKFPSVVVNKTIELYATKNGIKDYDVANITPHHYPGDDWKGNYTGIIIDDFERTFNDEKFVIEFKSDLQPKGKFGFINIVHNHLHSPSGRGNVNFVLGDEYECTGACVYSLNHIEETPNSFDRNIELVFRKGKDDSYSSFKLNAISRSILFKKPLFLGLGISFMVASLNFILVLLYERTAKK